MSAVLQVGFLLSSILSFTFALTVPSSSLTNNDLSHNFTTCEDRSIVRNPKFQAKAEEVLNDLKLRLKLMQKTDGDGRPRVKRDKTVVRCRHSYTGLFSFFAVPLIMGDIMLEFMNMIDISIMIMSPEAEPAPPPEPAEPAEPCCNNNNNNNGGGGGAPRSFSSSFEGKPRRNWQHESWDDILKNVTTEFIEERMPTYLDKYLSRKAVQLRGILPRSGDWTDSADNQYEDRGPFSGVLGWKPNSVMAISKHLNNFLPNKRYLTKKC